MRRYLLLACVASACGSDQILEHDLDPIELGRAPVEPGGALTGALLAAVTTPNGREPLLVDTAFPFDSLARAGCAPPGAGGWTYTGDLFVQDGGAAAAVRARFRSVGLFDLCPGPVGDSSVQPAGVLGGPLLASFSLGLTLPRTPSATAPAQMVLWPSFPGTDDQLAQGGWTTLHFELRGGATVGPAGAEASLTLPNSRIVLAACAAPRAFSPQEPVELCPRGQATLKASGVDVMLAVSTGAGPLVLSDRAWGAIAAQLGMAPDAGTAGLLYTPFSTSPMPALFVDVPRLALLQGTTDSSWLGACTELARARRIEWVMANQGSDSSTADPNLCFQRCDADGSKAVNTRPYLELGGSLRAAIVPQTSDLVRSLNSDSPPRPQVDGMVGAATLAGTKLRLDYSSQPSPRVIAACEDGSTSDLCRSIPTCPALGSQDQHHRCFGRPENRGWVPVCAQ